MTMTEKNEELIAEARKPSWYIEDKPMRERLVADLADALEAATSECAAVRENYREALISKAIDATVAEAERDAALAAIERVRAIAERSAVNPLIRIAEILAALDGRL